MDYQKRGQTILLRLDPGDEVLTSLMDVTKKEGIKTAAIRGIGACDEVEIGLYEVAEQHYEMRRFNEAMEMLALNGNISEQKGKPYLHAHAVFGRDDMSPVGGHLNKAVISGTGEIFIDLIEGRTDRKVCDITGLNIWDFSE